MKDCDIVLSAPRGRGGDRSPSSIRKMGFDQGVGHPHLRLSNAKVPNYRNNKAFKDLRHYSEWPKVADAVIEAEKCIFQRIEW